MPDLRLIYGRISVVLLSIAAAISIGTYLYFTSNVIFHSWEALPAGIKDIYVPFISLTKNILASIAAAIAVLIVIALLLYSRVGSLGKLTSVEERRNYSEYVAAFIALMILMSFISVPFVSPPGSLPNIVLNFEEQISILTLTFILQFIPITVLSLIFGMRMKMKPRDILMGNKRFSGEMFQAIWGIAFVFDAVTLYFLNGSMAGISGFVDYIQTLLLIIVSNVIYLKFGFWRAYLGNFVFVSMSVISYVVLSSPTLSIIFSVFLLLYVFVGFTLAATIGTRYYVERRMKELRARQEAERHVGEQETGQHVTAAQHLTSDQILLQRVKLWLHGGCPSCGNATFTVDSTTKLTCLKCGREVTSDESHPHNITISRGRIVVAMQQDRNEDLYS